MGSTLSASEGRRHGWLASSIGYCAPMLQRRKPSAKPSRGPKLSNRFDINGSDSFLMEKPIQVVTEQVQLPWPSKARHKLERPSPDHSTTPSFISPGAQTPRSCVLNRRSLSIRRPSTPKSCRLSISAPKDFRRLEEPSMPQLRSLEPLELQIHQAEGRTSPLPDFDSLYRDRVELKLSIPAAYRPRSTSLPSKLQSTLKIPRKALKLPKMDTAAERRQTQTAWPPRTSSKSPEHHPHPSLTTLYQHSSATSHELITAALPQLPQRPSPHHVRSPASSSIFLPQSRRSSDRSVRRLKTDIDEAIQELQTVIEEKRSTSRVTTSSPPNFFPSEDSASKYHVPAIAPSMKVRARSQTLSDIGSAFSRPLTPMAPRTMTGTAEKPLPEMPRKVRERMQVAVEPKPSQYLANKRPRHIRISQWIMKFSSSALEGNTSTLNLEPKQAYEFRTPEAEAGGSRNSIASTFSDSTSLTSLTSSTSEPGFPKVITDTSTHSSYSRPSTDAGPSFSKSAPVFEEVEIKSQVQVRIRRKQGSDVLKVQVPPPAYAVRDPHPSPRRVGMAR